ncbi:MAG: GerMN domain-containing protein [Lachnospiraceae bacterium]|nr:GerMN domain-containing protein [Lachnospiraceae bacterium]MDE6625643.1 GerMN domain-containing protein [Lachnospiraceae bacterium]
MKIKGGMMKRVCLLWMMLLAAVLVSCTREEEQTDELQALGPNDIYVYCMNLEKTDVVPVVYTVGRNNDLLENVTKVIRYLDGVETTANYQTPIPEGITYLDSSLGDRRDNIEISFSVLYDSVNADSLLFFKSCLVQSLLQLEGVDSVTIMLTDVANADADTATVSESFDRDSFMMSFDDDSGYVQKGNILLYFANETGEALKEYSKTVEISNTTSLARLVVESLIEGPSRAGYQATVADTVTIRNLSVKDGICYVDLSEEFYDTNNPLKNDIIVYSIVNSLAELPTVSKVQFLNSGEKQQFFRESMPFDGIFERNLDLIEQEIQVEEPEEDGKEEVIEE